ncbi:MAG: ATP-binding response regulator [Candidatus Rokuibacteriota bacterium]
MSCPTRPSFTPPGGHVRLRLERGEGTARLVVQDTGTGISPEFLSRIFERFHQAESTTRRSYSGLGLGLAIVKHLADLHGGTVSAESEGEARGSTFTVTLPLGESSRQVADVAPALAAASDPTLEGVHVVVVDDNADTLALASTMLEACGARVTTALSAQEALEIIARTSPDVLVSDIGMPDQDGYDLIRQLRARPADLGGAIPALALTAYAMEHDAQTCSVPAISSTWPSPSSRVRSPPPWPGSPAAADLAAFVTNGPESSAGV